jgi:hypothetical protein
MTTHALALTLLLMCCHWLADFTLLSTPYMLRAKAKGSPIGPIALHGAVHALLMGIVLFFFTDIKMALNLALAQWFIHTAIDTIKGRLSAAFPLLNDHTRSPYWSLLGADQWIHQATILAMVYITYSY